MLCKNRPCIWQDSVAKCRFNKLFIWFAVFSKSIMSGGGTALKLYTVQPQFSNVSHFKQFSSQRACWHELSPTVQNLERKGWNHLHDSLSPSPMIRISELRFKLKQFLWGFVSKTEGKLHCDSTNLCCDSRPLGSDPRRRLPPDIQRAYSVTLWVEGLGRLESVTQSPIHTEISKEQRDGMVSCCHLW